MLLHRKNDRRDASSTSDRRIRSARSGAGRIGLDPEQKIGAHEDPLDAGANAGVEISLRPRGLVEAESVWTSSFVGGRR